MKRVVTISLERVYEFDDDKYEFYTDDALIDIAYDCFLGADLDISIEEKE